MICIECGAENRDDARFCGNCGIEAERTHQAEDGKPCPSCGFENVHDAKYCANCGSEIHPRQHRPQQQPPTQARHKKKDQRVDTKLHWNPGVVGVILLAAGILFVAMLYEIGGQRRSQPAAAVELTSSDPALEANVLAIAAKFICSCGTCGEQPLESCRCNTAIQERQLIRTSLQSGKSSQEVILAVNNAFGWMKSEFAAKYDSTRRGQTVSSKLKVPVKKDSDLPFAQAVTATSKIATAGDRIAIFSRFTCRCGQCGIDELKDCSCKHPRGATEVKSFVDQKIAEGKYTIAQVVEQVEDKYGGRKF